MKTPIHPRKTAFGAALTGLALLLAAPAWADSSYSYFSVVEGPATVLEQGGERESVEPHMPILVGDRLWVPSASRLELVLSDRNLLRLEGDGEVEFEALAYSSDTEDRATVLRLPEGNLQLVVTEDALGDTLPKIVTPDATIYVVDPGTFRVTVSRNGWTELVVRDGRAEIVSERDAALVYAGDMAVAESGRYRELDVRLAASRDALERWGERLDREAALASVPYVDDSLRYSAAPLARHGVWVSIGSRHAWRPRVAVTWRPYGEGYWRSTPVGLTWVSHDPWGYVTHHYGSWDHVPGYGWLWYPGRRWAPAHVTWYWGSQYVGWCPTGYYASYYSGRHSGFGIGFGVYGWAGGWRHFGNWTFTASLHFGGRDQRRHHFSGHSMAQRHGVADLDRGIVTTHPGAGRKNPKEILLALRGEADRHERETGRRLPDVSDFVARKPLADDLRQAIAKPRLVKPAPATPTTVVSRKFPDAGKAPRRASDTGRAKDPMPRIDARTRREVPGDRGADADLSRRKPTTKPYRIEPRADDDRPRGRDLRDSGVVKPRQRIPSTEAKPRVETKPRYEPRARVETKPRYEPRQRVETKPRVEREPRYEPRARVEREPRYEPRQRVEMKPRYEPRQREVERYRETPRVSPGTSARPSKPPARVSPSSPPSKPKPSVRRETSARKPSARVESKPRSGSSKKPATRGKKTSRKKDG